MMIFTKIIYFHSRDLCIFQNVFDNVVLPYLFGL